MPSHRLGCPSKLPPKSPHLTAFDQPGAGKSYSFVGYGVNKGILPIVSTEIFAKV